MHVTYMYLYSADWMGWSVWCMYVEIALASVAGAEWKSTCKFLRVPMREEMREEGEKELFSPYTFYSSACYTD